MTFSVELINGGDFQNVGTPIKIEGETYAELEKNIKENFGLDEKSIKPISSYIYFLL